MKTMTCKQLGGSCDVEFHAETFDEMAKLSHAHGTEMREDPDHQKAMQAMMELMKEPEAMQKWFGERKAEFDALPEDE